MASLDDLMRRARSGDRGALGALQERRGRTGLTESTRKELTSLEKAAAKADREQQRLMAAAERERARQNKEAGKEYDKQAIAWYTDKYGNRIPITAPSGGTARKWDKSGTIWDTVTGKAYARGDDGKMTELVPEKDGKTVKKDGHVYKVVDGMKWKWLGYDKDRKTAEDRRFDRDLADKTRALKQEMQDATGELTLLNKDISSDRARIRDLDKRINDAEKLSGDQSVVARLQGEKEQIQGVLDAKVERQAKAEIDAYRAQAEYKAGREAVDAQRKDYYDNKSRLNFDEAKFPNTDRRPEATAGMSNYFSEFSKDLVAGMLGVQRTEPIKPMDIDLMAPVLANIEAGNKALGAASVANANAFADWSTKQTVSPEGNQWNMGKMQARSQDATARLSAEAEIKLPEAIRKATGVDYAPPSWFTPEAMERQLSARLAGQDVIQAPPGYKLEGGTLYATKETSNTFWGVPLPWSKKTTAEPVGKFKFDQYGVGTVELDPLAMSSPSFASGDYYRGMPEYLGMPKWFEDSAKPKMGSQVVPEVRKEVEGMDWQKAASEMWESRRWSPERLRDTLDQWQTANDRQRADLIAEMDPRQAALRPEDRRLDTGWLYQQGQLSAQDARLLSKTAYGTNPDFASLPDSFDQWAKNSPTAAAKQFREQQAALPKMNWWSAALTNVASNIPGAGVIAAAVGTVFNSERGRISSANTYAARDAFMSQYYQETARKTDFNLPAFVQARDKMLGDESLAGWANNALNSTLQNAFGSSLGVMLVQAPKLLLDGITGGRMLSDQERTLIGAQTDIALQNMHRAAQDRAPSSLGEFFLMTQPASYVFNLGGVRDKVWSGEKGGALNSATNDLYAFLNTGRGDEKELQRLSERVRVASEAFHAGSATRMSYENDPLDPRSTMNRAMKGYMETMSPAYWSMFKGGTVNSQYDLSIQQQAADYASQNGKISESSLFGPFQMALRGGSVAPLTETAIEIASNLIGVGAGKMLVAGKWLATAERAGLALNRAGRAVGKLEGMQEAFFDLGKVTRTPRTVLTAGQQLRNTAVDMSKMAWASGSGEMFEEVVASFGEAGATLGDAAAQGLSGFIGGMGLSSIHAPIGGALGSLQAGRYAAAQDKALKQYVADWNTRFAETPITLDQAKQSQGYQNRGLVGTLNSQLQALVAEDLRLANEFKSLPPTVGVPGAGGTPVLGVNPRIVEILSERESISGQIGATMLDVVGVSESSMAAVREINGLPPESQVVVDAAVRLVSGTPTTPAQEQVLLQNGAYVRGERVILSDALLLQLQELAPTTAKLFFKQQEAEQLAEADAVSGGQSSVPVQQQAPVQPPPLPQQPAAQTPVQPPVQPQAPAPAPAQAGGSFTFEATYTPKGSQRPVTVTQTVQAATAEEAQGKAQTWATAIERRLSDGPVQLGPVQGSGGAVARAEAAAPVVQPDMAVFEAKPTAKTVTAMVEAAAPVLFNNPALPNVVMTPRLYVTRRMSAPLTAEEYRALPPDQRKQYMAMPNGGMAAYAGSSSRGPTIFIDQGQLAKTLANVPPADRPARIAAMAREEVLHLATTEVRGPQELVADWERLPDVVKRRVVEAYYPSEVLADADQDWRNVAADPQQMAMEFWRMYLSAKLDGVTTEQVAFAQDVDRLAELDPAFASNLRQLLENLAEWLRDKLMGTLDDQTRTEFEDVAAKIEAELVRLEGRGVAPVAESSVSQETAETSAADEAMPENRAFVPSEDTGNWTSEALRAAVKNAAAAFGYKIVDTGIDFGVVDRYGNTVNVGTQMYDKLVPGSEVGQWIDKVGNSEFAAEIADKMATPGLHRVWFGHDFLTNLDNVVGQFGWSAVPDFILQLLKDSLTKSGIPFPGVELLVRDGTVSDRFATDWLSTNIGEVFGGGVAFFGTYRLAQAARQGNLSRPRVIFATVGVGIKLAAGVATAQPFLIISGLADAAILVTNLDAVKAAFKKGADMAKERPARPVVRPPQMVEPRVMPPQNPPAMAPPVAVEEAPAVVAPEPVVETPVEAVEAPQPAELPQGWTQAKMRIVRARLKVAQDYGLNVSGLAERIGNVEQGQQDNFKQILDGLNLAIADYQRGPTTPQPAVAERIDAQERIRDGNKLRRVVQGRESDAELPALADDLQRRGLIEDYLGLWWPTEAGLSLLEANEVTAARREREMASLPVGSKVVVPNYRSDSMADGTILITGEPKIDLAAGRQRSERGIVYPALSGSMRTFGIRADEISEVREVGSVAERIDEAAAQPARPRKRATKPKAATPAPRPASELDAAFADLERFLKPAEVRGPDGLTDTEREALQAEMMADQEAEAAEAVRDGGIDILDAVREAGGLPAKTNSKVYQYAGELQRIREAQRPGNAVGLKGTFNLFRNNAPDLDALIKDLQIMGFRDLATPSDLFDLVERRLSTGRPIYGYEGMVLAAAAQPAGADFIAALTRVADALYAEGVTTPEAMSVRLVKRFGNAMTPKLLSQVWANGTETDPDVQVSWKQIYQKAVDESGAAGNNQVGESDERQPSEETGSGDTALQADAGQAGAEPADIQSGAGGGGLEDGRGATGSARDNERVLNKLTLDEQGRDARIAETFADWPDGFDALGMPNLPKGITDPSDPRLQSTIDKATATIVAGSLANRLLNLKPGEVSRQELRDAIIGYFLRGGNDRKALSDVQEPQSQDNPLVVFMGGGGAAGKTSLLNREIAKGNIPDEGRVLSNPDEIREFLPEYDLLNSLNDARSSVITHTEASKIADEIERKARQNSFPLVIDGTMKNAEKALARIEGLREEGYRVKMIAVTIDPYEALIRSFVRGKSSKRYVPPDVLLGAHKGFNSALPAYIEALGDDLVIYDNSPRNPILLSAEDILSGQFSEVSARGGLNENATTPEELLGSYGEADRIERPEANPQRVAAEGILPLLEEGRKLNFEKDIQPITDAAWGGTLSAGTYEVKDAYDAMELAVNLFLARGGVFDADQGWKSFGPVGAIRALEDLQQRLPTQTKRSGRTDRYQQFSTPPVFSFVSHWVSGATAADVVLEPSAGIGGLAVYPKLDGATIIANELESKRIDFLREMGFDHLTTENAEQIDAILEPRFASGSLPRPTVVNMNPPFSNAAKSGKKGQTMVGAQHVEAALRALQPGGRLVAIVGEGMGLDTPTFRQWWQRMGQQYHVRANIWVDGRNYTKYGTSFSNRLLVIDKVAPPAGSTAANIIQGQVDDLADLITLLQGVRNDRPTIQPSSEQAGTGDDQSLEPQGNARPDAGARTGAGGRAGGAGRRTGGADVRPSTPERPTDSAGNAGGSDATAGLTGRDRPTRRGANDSERPVGRGINGQPALQGSGTQSVEQTGITVQGAQGSARDIQNEDDVFALYTPAKVRIPGAQKHLAPLVESAAMASVSPPDPTYTPNLPKEVITEGRISETSLENIVYAGQAHEQMLPNGDRRGYFIGDGTGVGKGRQIAGIIMDNMRQGRTKAVWISKTQGLIEDAKRDAQDVGLDPASVFSLSKVKTGKQIAASDGILFTTYDTLKGKHETMTEGADAWWDNIKKHNSRMKQIAEWLGRDFDGVIAMDEAHKAGNAIAVRGKRGVKQPSQAGVAIVDLQALLPKARIVYVSATGATEVENLSYADRLGVWGEGTPFPNKQDFFNKIRAGGVSAMEVVARDLKAQGLYLARSISYKGVEFERLTHNLTPEQEEIYDKIATAWQKVLSNMDRVMDETNASNSSKARNAAASAFWGAQQRFFNQLLTTLQLPALLKDMDQQLKAGNSVVLQLVNTGEAVEKRAIAKAQTEAEGDDVPLEDLDLSPRQILLDFLEKSFPTDLYEKVQDPKNPDRAVWEKVKDSKGNPVQSPSAVAEKNRLMDEVALVVKKLESPLNQILNHFGSDNVAEVTGRKQRVVEGKEGGKNVTKLEKRGKAQARSEAKDFQDGKRRILIFSDAGGTGYSFHSSNRAKNKQRRVHYLVQAGWRADNALQGFGRTHRTDQANAPIYRLLETNIKGHKRFIASIARRLAQLGALTTGERRTAGQGMFSDSDNLESPYSSDALFRLMTDIYNERVEGLSFDEFAEALGYSTMRNGEKVNTLISQQGGLNNEKLPPITQFLNRILALPLSQQNMVFDLFMDRLERRIETAKADGSFDHGTQNYYATRIEVRSDDIIYTQANTNATTRLVEIEAFNDQVFTTFEEAERGGAIMWVRNRKSGNVYALREGPQKTLDTGAVVETWRRVGTTGNDLLQKKKMSTAAGRMEGDKLVDAGNYIEMSRDEAAAAWDSEVAASPKEVSKKDHFLVGVMLPVWDRIGLERTRIFRFTPTTGEPMLGVQVPSKDVPGLRMRMGARNTMTADQAFDMVLADGATMELANGWTILRRRVSGEWRVEVSNLSYSQGEAFARDFGGIMERIQYTPRFFITDAEVMQRVMDRSPVTQINGEDVNFSDNSPVVAGAARRLVTPEDMDADMDDQARWLLEQSQLRDYENTDELLAEEPETFLGLAAQWRETHPRAVGSPAQGAGVGGQSEDGRIEALVTDNLGLATALASRFNIPRIDFEDKVQEARIGLLTAAQSFDQGRGVPFGAYATRVIRNRLNKLYREQRRIAGAETRELDAPVGEMDGETGQSMLADRFENDPAGDDLAAVREIMDSLPARPRRIWEGLMSGKTNEAIAKEEGISKQAVNKMAQATKNTLRAQLAKRGIRSVDDVFAQKDPFDTGRVEGMRQELEDEESKVAAARPSVEAELAQIAEERQKAQDYRKAAEQTPNGPLLPEAKEAYNKWLRGRMDKLEFYAPGAKAAMLDNRRNEALVAATINSMMQQIRDDVTRAFGYPAFWSKNKKRLQNFLDELLPVAARLEVDRLDDNGDFVFKSFLMRAGTINASKVRSNKFKVGDMIATDRGTFELGPEIDGGRYLLMKAMPAEVQQQIYQDFHARYPESAHYLDRWIMPGMQEARYMGPQGTMTAEFNRYALRDLFNEWPQELKDLFGGVPLPDLPYVEGYTPDVAEAKTLGAMIGSLMRSFRSGARKMKAGEARETGNIKNLFEGFSVRAMEAHREKIRVLTRQRLIEAAAVDKNRIPREQMADFRDLDQTYSKLLEAVKIARRLNPKAFPTLTTALSPRDQKAMAKILGDAFRLRGRGLMIHKEVERELMLGISRQVTNNTLTRILSGLLERFNAGLLATPFTVITNWASNEIIKVVRMGNRLNYALISIASGDVNAAKLGGYELMYLMRGFITDRFPQWQQERIGKVVPREMFDDQTGLEAMDIDPNISVKQQLGRLNLGGAFMQAVGYGEIDIRQKQQMAYAAYRAHAQVAWNEAKRRGEVSDKNTNRREWQQNWIANAPAEIHRDVYLTTVMYLMDYQNVPAWLDPQQSMTAVGQIVKRSIFPFVKWPYNMARQFKRLTFDAALNTVMAGRTKQQRIEGMANLMTMGALAAVGTAIAMADDDEDDPLLGASVDEEGNLLDAAFRTKNRLNLSRLARIIFAHGLMRDAEFTLDDGSGESKDLWWRYRNYPYLKEGIAMGLLLAGKTDKALEQFADITEEYVSLGMLAKIVGMSSFDRDKPVGFRLGEVAYDVGTAGVLPTPWRQFATRMVDPVMRRSREAEPLGYTAGPLDAIRANTPFLSRTVPTTGQLGRDAFAPFSAEKWFSKEKKAVERSDMPVEEKRATIESLRQQATKLNMTPAQQADFMKLAGLPVEQFNMRGTSTVPTVANLERLRSMGVGPEAYAVIETTDKLGRASTQLVAPKASNIGYQPRGLQALRFFGGVNLMAVPRGQRELAK